jgi:hypothetical protein
MTKLRLPKPIAGNVIHRHLHLGSVYTKEQMRAFAEKAVLVEREACAKVCDDLIAPALYNDADKSMWDVTCMDCAAAIRNREQL